ncbi:hypothetical protein AD937_09605 [Gluconobacter japonicus]|nr:hypothetical protein AD935_05340 [Gluconobacter japonicus]KXV25406.1 hypothetical protein AD937_09605 [Gluconobacter japonicus]
MGDFMIFRRSFLAVFALATGAITPLTALAQGAPSQTQIDGQSGQQSAQIPPQFRADAERAMRYVLPADFMPRAVSAISELQGRNIQPPNSQGLGLQDMIARASQVPGFPDVLRSHGFTPETFIIGMTTFGMTLAASNGQVPAGMPSPNPSNVALFKAHPDQVNALMQAMGNPPH